MPYTITKCMYFCEPLDIFKTLKQNSFHRKAICGYLVKMTICLILL